LLTLTLQKLSSNYTYKHEYPFVAGDIFALLSYLNSFTEWLKFQRKSKSKIKKLSIHD